MTLRVVSLPGDGIGPEVCDAAVRVLAALPLAVAVEEHSFGGHAIHEHGDPLPAETLAACRAADAVLLVTGDGLKTPGPVADRFAPIDIPADADALLAELGVAV